MMGAYRRCSVYLWFILVYMLVILEAGIPKEEDYNLHANPKGVRDFKTKFTYLLFCGGKPFKIRFWLFGRGVEMYSLLCACPWTLSVSGCTKTLWEVATTEGQKNTETPLPHCHIYLKMAQFYLAVSQQICEFFT